MELYGELAWIWPLLSPPEDYLDEAPYYIQHFRALGVPDGGEILHLGSGGGSIDWHLKKQYQVTGVDMSPQMLEHAWRNNPECSYFPGDIRSIQLERTFDGVLLHDAIAYMTTPEDLRAAFQTAADHLEPGGAFVCLPEQLRETFQQFRTHKQTHKTDELCVTTLEVAYDRDPSDHEFESAFSFTVLEDGQFRFEHDVHRMGIHTLQEFKDAAGAAGLAVTEDEPPLDMEPGERFLLLVGRKG